MDGKDGQTEQETVLLKSQSLKSYLWQEQTTVLTSVHTVIRELAVIHRSSRRTLS